MNKHSKQARILAWIGIAVIICLVLYMLYCAFTGQNFMGSLYLIVVVPVIIWAILFFSGKLYDKDDENDEDKQ